MVTEFFRSIWELRIPIEITFCDEELLLYGLETFRDDKERPFCILQMRQSYLVLLIPQLRRHYPAVFTAASRIGAQAVVSPWFQWNETPLSFHYPAGHLYDELCAWQSAEDSHTISPWRIKLRLFDRPPSLVYSQLFNMDDEGLLRAHFYSLMKQADYIRYGSSKRVMNLTKSEQLALWDGLWTQSFDKYWVIFQKIFTDDLATCKHLPWKFYFKADDANTHREVVSGLLQDSPGAVLEDLMKEIIGHDVADYQAIIHGIKIPLETPVIWISRNLISHDGFVHCVIGHRSLED